MLTESSAMNEKIYKIVRTPDWIDAEKAGVFKGSADDARDGFVHFSAAHQLRATSERYFRGQADLVLVAADAAALGEALKWEASRGGDLFPHLYGLLPMSAIAWTKPLPLGPDGRHRFPDEIP
jgi:uncharacterized protein (DUF952 family)